jgi:hypothetical protein
MDLRFLDNNSKPLFSVLARLIGALPALGREHLLKLNSTGAFTMPAPLHHEKFVLNLLHAQHD